LKKYDLIIIGGGVAGLTTAIYALRSGLSVLLFEREMIGGQSVNANEIANYPGFVKISGAELSLTIHNQAELLGLETLYDEVVSVDLKKKIVNTESSHYQASCIVVAMGAKPRKLNVRNENEFTSRGVHYCATCDGNFYKNKGVVVVGGGNTAIEEAMYLSNICSKVTIVCRKSALNGQKILVDKLMKNKNVSIVYNFEVDEIIADDVVKGVKLKNGQVVACDAVFVAIGREPNTELVINQLNLENNYIVADENMHTSIDGVFVAGDIRVKNLRQLATAIGDGAIAGTEASKYVNERR
jgi:thioredoxin reductase (NADPH)